MDVNKLLNKWNDPLTNNTMNDAKETIDALLIEIAGKEAVIKELENDIKYYRKDWKDQMIQDQGLKE